MSSRESSSARSEEEIINLLTQHCKKAPDLYGIGDDCAALEHCVISTDTMIEGVHFDERISPLDLGWKLVAINASDIASMGKHPSWSTLNLSLPGSLSSSWLSEFATGLWKALNHWSVHLVGGDTTRSPGPIMISMTMGGKGNASPIWRSGAKCQDEIYITGQLGRAALGFYHPQFTTCVQHFHRPNPPTLFAAELAELKLIHAMMDVSDGLHKDLLKMCQASSVDAHIDLELLPYPKEAENLPRKWSYIVGFGEDYEMLFTASNESATKIKRLATKHNVNISRIGVITKKSGKEAQPHLKAGCWPPSLFSHFE